MCSLGWQRNTVSNPTPEVRAWTVDARRPTLRLLSDAHSEPADRAARIESSTMPSKRKPTVIEMSTRPYTHHCVSVTPSLSSSASAPSLYSGGQSFVVGGPNSAMSSRFYETPRRSTRGEQQLARRSGFKIRPAHDAVLERAQVLRPAEPRWDLVRLREVASGRCQGVPGSRPDFGAGRLGVCR